MVAVVQSTNASGPGGARVLGEAQPVYGGDRIATGDVGQAQILFGDQTRLVVGSNSSVVIDRFVHNASTSATGAAMRFAKGTFRFMTGTGSGGSYRLQTPTATIGIRGTEFDIAVGPRFGTAVIVFNGTVEVCSRASRVCAIVQRSCGAVVATPNGRLELPEGADHRDLIRTSFPLTASQRSLRSDFRVSTRNCGGPRNARVDSRGRTTRAAVRVAPRPGPEEPGPGPEDPEPQDPGPEDPGAEDPGPGDPGPQDPGPSVGAPPEGGLETLSAVRTRTLNRRSVRETAKPGRSRADRARSADNGRIGGRREGGRREGRGRGRR